MRGSVVSRIGRVHEATRQIQQVAGLDVEFKQRGRVREHSRAERLAGVGQIEDRRIDLPLLGAGNLKDENVVHVIVRTKARHRARRDVDIGVDGVIEIGLDGGGEPRERPPCAMKTGQRNGARRWRWRFEDLEE
jgi:hypothetical protein